MQCSFVLPVKIRLRLGKALRSEDCKGLLSGFSHQIKVESVSLKTKFVFNIERATLGRNFDVKTERTGMHV